MAQTRTPPPAEKQPAYWFALLDLARERGDFAQAAEAQKRLAQLGVKVTYTPAKAKAVAHA